MSPVPIETFATLYESTLSGGITNVATSVPATTRSGAPTTGQWRMLIQDAETDKTNREIVLVTGGMGSGAGSFTVTRGVEGTTAVAHGAGSYVADVQTAEAIRRWLPNYARQPRQNKLLAWPYPPEFCTGASSPVAGVGYYIRCYVPEDMTFATAWLLMNAGSSAGIANAYLALYDKTGQRRGVTADQAANWQSSGIKSAALVVDAGQSLAVAGGPDEYVYVGLLIGTQGGTQALVYRGMAAATFANVGLANGSEAPLYGTAGSGLSALPTTFTPSTISQFVIPWWAGLS